MATFYTHVEFHPDSQVSLPISFLFFLSGFRLVF